MCDYSITVSNIRLAVEGEELVTHRFSSGSLGLTTHQERERYSHQSGWRSWFLARPTPCAVCIPPGARLLLRDLPERLQRALGISSEEEVTFIQATLLEGRHRDGVLFDNHQQILLQRLSEGQRVKVLSLSSENESPDSVPLGMETEPDSVLW